MSSEIDRLDDDELRAKAAEVGLDARGDRDALIERVRRRCDVIDGVSRDELAGILRWAGQDVPDFNTRDALVQRFYELEFRDTEGLSLEDLRVIARLREIPFEESTDRDDLARRIRKRRRHWSDAFKRVGGKVAGLFARGLWGSDPDPLDDPPQEGENGAAAPPATRPGGVVGGIKRGGKAMLKALADDYVTEKLDEIEQRIDRKLDDIDRKMDEWRTKEIRHRLRILKITIIATVVVAAISLVYTIIRRYGMP